MYGNCVHVQYNEVVGVGAERGPVLPLIRILLSSLRNTVNNSSLFLCSLQHVLSLQLCCHAHRNTRTYGEREREKYIRCYRF